MHRPQTGGASSNPFSCGGGGGSTRNLHYNLTVSMQIRNLLDHNNPGPVIGIMTSPLFGRPISPLATADGSFQRVPTNWRLELQTRLSF